ncbi:DUF1428 domain-containing protein [Aurantiacibacter spongiae]|uniref:DUF1428 domain-containing protein n=1 Tax=Aurantiacibacter spongiae TaxID=2488860 RepID=A0A3N5DSS2_9SPHN|nr:DUF1428 domain-containing protein [Aurantiacibacter spongiae]RPF72321.1 DUF1428 domain-containing protein [Aurantiacibacter spongiae]
MTYVSAFVTPVEDANRDEYLASARAAWPMFKDYGALAMMENWGVNVPEGKRTDLRRAVDLRDGESVVFSWVVWPDKATSDACEASMQTDERWQTLAMPFDGTRMIYGGFETIFSAEA